MARFATRRISEAPDTTAPDGSEVRLLAATSRGSMAHFRLSPGSTSKAMRHRTVDEVWFFTGGRGMMWRRLGEDEGTVAVSTGMSVSIPVGTAFQFRATGEVPLDAVAVTMPPWPGPEEAEPVDGVWPASV